jgi:hypothetical protein
MVLRVPGTWNSKDEIIERLPDGCRIDDCLLWLGDGPALELQMLPADRDFPNVFRSACRRALPSAALKELAAYRHHVVILAPGGSIPCAQHLLAAGAALVRAGGIGVFIDSSCLAHAGPDWLDLAEHRCNPQALMYAFVNFIRSTDNVVRSQGMHVFGQREGIIHPASKMPALEDFVLMVCAMHPPLDEGYVFADQQGARFRLRSDGEHGPHPNDLITNPFGCWRLEQVA